MPQTASCELFDADLSALIDGELSAERERELRAHLDDCERCTRRLDSLRQVDALLETPLPRVRPAVRDAVLRPAAPPRRAPRRRSLRWLGAPLAAAAALALYLAVRPPTDTLLDAGSGAPLAQRGAELDEIEAGSIEQPSTLIAEPMVPPALPPPPDPEIPRFELELEPPGELLADAAKAESLASQPASSDAELEGESAEDLAIVLLGAESPDDIDVIANMEILERLLALEEGRG